jgi:hypothetical protein
VNAVTGPNRTAYGYRAGDCIKYKAFRKKQNHPHQSHPLFYASWFNLFFDLAGFVWLTVDAVSA